MRLGLPDEAQFTALRYFTLDGTDHANHREQGSMIRRYTAWRNRHTSDPDSAGSSTGRPSPDAAVANGRAGRVTPAISGVDR